MYVIIIIIIKFRKFRTATRPRHVHALDLTPNSAESSMAH